MADDNFRSYRNRDPLPRDATDRIGGNDDDPLAELARLIGQSDPYPETRQPDAYKPEPLEDHAAASGEDWAADDQHDEPRAEDDYAPAPSSAPAADTYASYAPQERSYDREPAGGRHFSGPATPFSGFREQADADYRDERVPALRARELPAYATSEVDEDYAEEPEYDEAESDAAGDYYDEPARPRRRGAVVMVMAVLSLAVVGTAGAFGYRAMFGGSVIPSLPPIIKANNGPIKVAPNYGETPGGNSTQPDTVNPGASEKVVSREEQPVSIEPPKAPPRVVSSIPVVPNPSPPAMTVGQPPGATAQNPAPNSPWPPGPPPMPNAVPTPNPAPAQLSTEPKRIHTVTIRPDQAATPDGTATPPVPPPAPKPSAARPAPPVPKPAATASPAPAGPNAPLSIVPGGHADVGTPPPAHVRAAAPIAVATAAPVQPAPSPGGGYAVQVTSQRSETEAQTSFRELQAKFPNQLGGRTPIIRRADLGDKGTYYRALVGPFASAEAAAGMCSGLKAAGGNCIVQKN